MWKANMFDCLAELGFFRVIHKNFQILIYSRHIYYSSLSVYKRVILFERFPYLYVLHEIVVKSLRLSEKFPRFMEQVNYSCHAESTRGILFPNLPNKSFLRMIQL